MIGNEDRGCCSGKHVGFSLFKKGSIERYVMVYGSQGSLGCVFVILLGYEFVSGCLATTSGMAL